MGETLTVAKNGDSGQTGGRQPRERPRWRPIGWREFWGEEALRSVLRDVRYGDFAMRVSEIGVVDEQPVALFYIDPECGWLDGHFDGKTILRHVEPIEICAQAVLAVALAEGRIRNVTGIGFVGSSHDIIDESRIRPVLPGQTVAIPMSEAEFQYSVKTEKPDGVVILRASWTCLYGCDSLKAFATTTGKALVTAERGPNFHAPFGAKILASSPLVSV